MECKKCGTVQTIPRDQVGLHFHVESENRSSKKHSSNAHKIMSKTPSHKEASDEVWHWMSLFDGKTSLRPKGQKQKPSLLSALLGSSTLPSKKGKYSEGALKSLKGFGAGFGHDY